MRILLTGSEGYIGSGVRAELDHNGYSVNEFDIKSGDDIRRMSDLERAMIWDAPIDGEMIDVVVHLAGIVGDPACRQNMAEAYKTNIEGTRNIIRFCDRYDLPLVFASTCSVYGKSDQSADEVSSSVNPLSYYAVSKWASEREIVESLSNYIILRFGTVYGASPNMRWDLVANIMTRSACENGYVEIYGRGQQRRPFVSTKTISEVIDTSCELVFSQRYQQILNVVEFNTTIESLGIAIAEFLDSDLRYIDSREDDRDYSVSGEKINSLFEKNVFGGSRAQADLLENPGFRAEIHAMKNLIDIR